ncbi:hypothetical protein, partial [Mesorhizobium japonicum]|uniref:hypothetical protein n=1 Tax=Mesorhizobium japonicum TaxID=2066070 RepID=UPI003B5A3D65
DDAGDGLGLLFDGTAREVASERTGRQVAVLVLGWAIVLVAVSASVWIAWPVIAAIVGLIVGPFLPPPPVG